MSDRRREPDLAPVFEQLLRELLHWARGHRALAAEVGLDMNDLVQDAVVRLARSGFEVRHAGAVRMFVRASVMNRIRDTVRRAEERRNGGDLELLQGLHPRDRRTILERLERPFDTGELRELSDLTGEGVLRRALRRLRQLFGRDRDGRPPSGPLSPA